MKTLHEIIGLVEEPKKFRVTRKFIGGVLDGYEFTEDTSLDFYYEGMRVDNPIGGSPYVIMKVEKLQEATTLA